MLTAQATKDVEERLGSMSSQLETLLGEKDVAVSQLSAAQLQLKAARDEAEAYMVRCCAMVS